MQEVPVHERRPFPIDRVADQRMPQPRHVDAYLVCPAGHRRRLDQRDARVTLDHAIASEGVPPSGDNGHLLTAPRVTGDGLGDLAFVAVDHARDEREVGLAYHAPLELRRERAVRGVSLGHGQQT